jgi:hypothetical protein
MSLNLSLINFTRLFSELKTDEDDHWQQRNSFNEKQSKFKSELKELDEVISPWVFISIRILLIFKG